MCIRTAAAASLLLFACLLSGGAAQQQASQSQKHGFVYELTPELQQKWEENISIRRYYVLLNAGPPCQSSSGDTVCDMLNQRVWMPLAQKFDSQVWTKLECQHFPRLCHMLSTSARVHALQVSNRQVDFLTVVLDRSPPPPSSTLLQPWDPPPRLVEMYREGGSAGMEKLIAEFIALASHPELPHLPLRSDEIANVHPAGTVKKERSLAILVLTTDGFERPDVWKAFFESSDDDLVLFVHDKSTKPLNCCNDSVTVVTVPTIFTSRATISLVRAATQLLRHALAFGAFGHYVLVSGDTVPLQSASTVIERLRLLTNVSVLETHSQPDATSDFNELRRTPAPTALRKTKNWFLFAHQDAVALANDNSNGRSWADFEILPMSDEYYWGDALGKTSGLSVDATAVMYDEWPIEASPRPRTFSHKFDANLVRQKTGRDYLFARKVTSTTRLTLDWMGLNESHASAAKNHRDIPGSEL